MITLEQAKQLKTGQMIYHVTNRNNDKSAQRWKVTSVKTWQTRPNELEIHLKNGLKKFGFITQDELHLVSLKDSTK